MLLFSASKYRHYLHREARTREAGKVVLGSFPASPLSAVITVVGSHAGAFNASELFETNQTPQSL